MKTSYASPITNTFLNNRLNTICEMQCLSVTTHYYFPPSFFLFFLSRLLLSFLFFFLSCVQKSDPAYKRRLRACVLDGEPLETTQILANELSHLSHFQFHATNFPMYTSGLVFLPFLFLLPPKDFRGNYEVSFRFQTAKSKYANPSISCLSMTTEFPNEKKIGFSDEETINNVQ